MNLWDQFKEHTQARIGLHRTGHSISTRELLDFQLAHALAHDAVHEIWDMSLMAKKLRLMGEKPLKVETAVHAKERYLKFPNLGRALDKSSEKKLRKYKAHHITDVVFIVTDGLSARAIDKHFIPFWKVLKPAFLNNFEEFKTTMVLAPFGRVALSDAIGVALSAKLAVMLVGERPGLTSADSLGIYLTYNPERSNTDANRNCISNIHPPQGMPYAIAAEKLLYLIGECLRHKISGVSIKDASPKQLEKHQSKAC